MARVDSVDGDARGVTVALFGRGVVGELLRTGRSDRLARIVQSGALPFRPAAHHTLESLYRRAFGWLAAPERRDGYVYKEHLLRLNLCAWHRGESTATLEFAVGHARADLVVFNGKAVAYEMKSERDDLTRLERQLDAYVTLFDEVWLVCPPQWTERVHTGLRGDVGVMCLGADGRPHVARPAAAIQTDIDVSTLLSSISVSDAQALFLELGIELPAVPNTRRFAAMLEQLRACDPAAVRRAWPAAMRQSRGGQPAHEALARLPLGLGAVVSKLGPSSRGLAGLQKTLRTPIAEVRRWPT